MSRLATGGLIDRAQPLDFTFDGKRWNKLGNFVSIF